ncbi:hypothetical protein BCR33DRAFT_738906 [Rhizoclosmatium globosum]|uniref:C2H2-type domain-containing protein n=1 Tax=Rhizoclosmatium globosum TaxID=329046 RepID=A0A1Y2CA20_9FUNG|nr:hypothetical protein BCR33DRAFT_738906 [Rhizoclosmatium globosum]|eukprot:ORY43175.1 hypothetical protein BCR33DRAFT_738906 [Rhizoclosmatium globosum]
MAESPFPRHPPSAVNQCFGTPFIEPIPWTDQFYITVNHAEPNHAFHATFDHAFSGQTSQLNHLSTAVHTPTWPFGPLLSTPPMAFLQGEGYSAQSSRNLPGACSMANHSTINRSDDSSNLGQPAPTQDNQTIKPIAKSRFSSSTPPLRARKIGDEVLPSEREEALHRHIRALKAHRTRPSIKKSFRKCPECGTVFETSVLLACHLRDVHKIRKCPFGGEVKECTMELNANWREYCIVLHSGAPKPVCPECGNSFSSVTSRFRSHLKQCRGGEAEQDNEGEIF